MTIPLMEKPAPVAEIPGAIVLRRVRKLLITALVGALAYSLLTTGTWARCLGGYDGSGGFIDGSGEATELAPTCLTLTLRANPLIYVVLALIVIGALSSVLKKSRSEADALRYVDAAAVVVVLLLATCIVVSHVWFWNLPVQDWDGGTTDFFYPFLFGSVTADITPQAG
jgi:hypothetical protein